jgi:hypothetical protein
MLHIKIGYINKYFLFLFMNTLDLNPVFQNTIINLK